MASRKTYDRIIDCRNCLQLYTVMIPKGVQAATHIARNGCPKCRCWPGNASNIPPTTFLLVKPGQRKERS